MATPAATASALSCEREFDVDLFVIGGGSGGIRAARVASRHGAKVIMSLLVNARGAAFTSDELSRWFANAVDQAGLPDECKMHGLRKTAAKTLAEVGCTAHEIMAVTGHKSLKEVQRYTQAADETDVGGGDPQAGTERKLNCKWQTRPPGSGKQLANSLMQQ